MSEHRRLSGDEGVVFAEFALVLPFILWMVLGIFEFGNAWRNTTIVSAGLRSAVRIEAQAKQAPLSDMNAVLSFQSSMAQTKNMTITKILVYNATSTATSSAGSSGKPSTSCLGATTSSTISGCNVYSGSRLTSANLVAANFGTSSGCVAANYDYNYCPTSRLIKLTDNSSAGPDLIGVYAEITYTSMTRIISKNVTVKDNSVARIEPDA